jgi:uncharacterized membrane protein/protein-disulfide isomerase
MSNAQATKFDKVGALLGLIGFGVSVYALIEHIKLEGGAQGLGCDINDLVSCTKVLGSSYGKLIGIPLGSFGMAFFGMVFAVSVLPALASVSKRFLHGWQLVVGAVGACVALSLAYLAYFEIKAVCVVCSTIHVLSLMFFLWALIQFRRVRMLEGGAEDSAFLKFVSLSLAIGVPSLVLGLVLPSLWSPSNADATTAKKEPVVAGTFPPDTLTFNKSDFVGKGQDYRKGNDNAKVVLFMYSDLECPHCKNTNEAILKALSVVGDKVLYVYRNYPLSNKCNAGMGSEGHKYACDLAMAARCAGQQGKFWEYKDWAFTGIEMSGGEKEKSFSAEGLKAKALEMGLDANRFQQCVDSKVELAKIQEDIGFGQRLGLTGTPLLILNGRKFQTSPTPDAFVKAFEAELAAVK